MVKVGIITDESGICRVVVGGLIIKWRKFDSLKDAFWAALVYVGDVNV